MTQDIGYRLRRGSLCLCCRFILLAFRYAAQRGNGLESGPTRIEFGDRDLGKILRQELTSTNLYVNFCTFKFDRVMKAELFSQRAYDGSLLGVQG